MVCIPLATVFNEMVASDLKFLDRYCFIVFVDLATRYCAAQVICNKKPETIISAFLDKWISVFGAPRKLLTDNGREYNNPELRILAETFNFKVYTTAAESPWSNGIVERLNGILGQSVSKIREEVGCGIQTALAWAVAARNALDNNGGHSPNTLVLSFNPAFPNIFNSRPPGLEEVTSSDVVRQNLNALHTARQEFVKSENSERIRRALKYRTRHILAEEVSNGDEVYYKRQKEDVWRGPGSVIGKCGKTVIVKHGGETVRVHAVSIMRAPEKVMGMHDVRELFTDSIIEPNSNSPMHEEGKTKRYVETNNFGVKKAKFDDLTAPVSDSPADSNMQVGMEKLMVNDTGGIPVANHNNMERCRQDSQQRLVENITGGASVASSNRMTSVMEGGKASEDISAGEDTVQGTDPKGCSSSNPLRDEVICENLGTKSSKAIPKTWKPKMRFQGFCKDTGAYVSGEVISRAGKSTGRNRSQYNVVLDQGDEQTGGQQRWFDMNSLDELSVLENENEILIMYATEEVFQAKLKEFKSWEDNMVMEKVEDTGQDTISARWVITQKEHADKGSIIKARLVARGYEESKESLRTDSPTCSKEGMRIFLTIASAMGWICYTIDVRSAYLQGDGISRVVFIRPPKEFADGRVWKLKKTVYGLCDAARAWYLKVRKTLEELGMVSNEILNGSLYYWSYEGMLQGLLAVHVDDFLWAGTPCFKHQVMDKFSNQFQIGCLVGRSFTYLGLRLCTFRDGITIDQIPYAASLDYIPIDKKKRRAKDSALTDKEWTLGRAKVGQLNWLATHTRPDIAYEVSILGTYMASPKFGDLDRINKLIDIAKKDPIQIYFPRLDRSTAWEMICYVDAATPPKGAEMWGQTYFDSLRSQGAYIIFLQDKNGQRSVIDWRSKKIDRVVTAPFAAELLATVDAVNNCKYLATILYTITGRKLSSVTCYTDSKSLVDNLYSTHQLDDRQQRLDIGVLKQNLTSDEFGGAKLIIKWVKGSDQLADAMTKRGVNPYNLRAALDRDTRVEGYSNQS